MNKKRYTDEELKARQRKARLALYKRVGTKALTEMNYAWRRKNLARYRKYQRDYHKKRWAVDQEFKERKMAHAKAAYDKITLDEVKRLARSAKRAAYYRRVKDKPWFKKMRRCVEERRKAAAKKARGKKTS